MPFITTPERIAMQDTMWTWIEDLLRLKFGDRGASLMPEVTNVYDLEQLRSLHLTIAKAANLDEVRLAIPTAPPAGQAEG